MVLKQKLGRKRVRLPVARCYAVTVFTAEWRAVRHFYTHFLGGRIISERDGRYFDLVLGNLPLSFRTCENGEEVSYFHLYLAVDDRPFILERLREGGVIVRCDATYACFLDPDGRTVKLSERLAVVR